MSDWLRQRYANLQIEALLEKYGRLRIAASASEDLVLVGPLRFRVRGPNDEVIEDQYEIELRVPPTLPVALPTARETQGRIPTSYHKLEGDLLCLGSPTEIRLRLSLSPTLLTFVEGLVVPYLYGHSFYVKHGRAPFGELAHGKAGLRQYLADLFGAKPLCNAEEFLRLAGMPKSKANRQDCPCGSGRRLGACHNRRVNNVRKRAGRLWCRDEYKREWV
jgi:hypothetical protein